jgi:hypothetical protein
LFDLQLCWWLCCAVLCCVLHQGIPPAALSKVSSDSLRELITTCIAHDPRQRPGALQLLKHAFFADLAERPSGSPTYASGSSNSRHSTTFSPPFGSCGNLMALAHGSIGQQLNHLGSHGSSRRESRGPSGDGAAAASQQKGDTNSGGGSGSASGGGAGELGVRVVGAATAAAGAGRQDSGLKSAVRQAVGQPSSGDAPAPAQDGGASPSSPKPKHHAHFAIPFEESAACESLESGSTAANTAAAGSSTAAGSGAAAGSNAAAAGGSPPDDATLVAQMGDSVAARNAGAVAAAAAGGARGTTVCVAKIGRAVPPHEEEVRWMCLKPCRRDSL